MLNINVAHKTLQGKSLCENKYNQVLLFLSSFVFPFHYIVA